MSLILLWLCAISGGVRKRGLKAFISAIPKPEKGEKSVREGKLLEVTKAERAAEKAEIKEKAKMEKMDKFERAKAERASAERR